MEHRIVNLTPWANNVSRKIMAIKVTPKEKEGEEKGEETGGVIYQVPLPTLADLFHINGVVFKVSYQRESPFRISAEPTGEVVLEVLKQLEEAQKKPAES